jgi:hypothetical protein
MCCAAWASRCARNSRHAWPSLLAGGSPPSCSLLEAAFALVALGWRCHAPLAPAGRTLPGPGRLDVTACLAPGRRCWPCWCCCPGSGPCPRCTACRCNCSGLAPLVVLCLGWPLAVPLLLIVAVAALLSPALGWGGAGHGGLAGLVPATLAMLWGAAAALAAAQHLCLHSRAALRARCSPVCCPAGQAGASRCPVSTRTCRAWRAGSWPGAMPITGMLTAIRGVPPALAGHLVDAIPAPPACAPRAHPGTSRGAAVPRPATAPRGPGRDMIAPDTRQPGGPSLFCCPTHDRACHRIRARPADPRHPAATEAGRPSSSRSTWTRR